jgi:hypothetical protein
VGLNNLVFCEDGLRRDSLSAASARRDRGQERRLESSGSGRVGDGGGWAAWLVGAGGSLRSCKRRAASAARAWMFDVGLSVSLFVDGEAAKPG